MVRYWRIIDAGVAEKVRQLLKELAAFNERCVTYAKTHGAVDALAVRGLQYNRIAALVFPEGHLENPPNPKLWRLCRDGDGYAPRRGNSKAQKALSAEFDAMRFDLDGPLGQLMGIPTTINAMCHSMGVCDVPEGPLEGVYLEVHDSLTPQHCERISDMKWDEVDAAVDAEADRQANAKNDANLPLYPGE